jgi:hypothetical protein
VSLGVHFGIDEVTARKLRKARNDDALMERVEAIEEADDFEDRAFETDKAWDALRHCFTEGTLELAFFGGEVLNKGDEYWVVLLTPEQVSAVASELARVDRTALRKKYDAIPASDYDSRSEEDFEHTWSTFQGLPEFFVRMAKAGQHVIFTVG